MSAARTGGARRRSRKRTVSVPRPSSSTWNTFRTAWNGDHSPSEASLSGRPGLTLSTVRSQLKACEYERVNTHSGCDCALDSSATPVLVLA